MEQFRFERGGPGLRRPRFRMIPARMLVPNLITLLALCAGLTGVRLAMEGRLEWALAAIVFAALLDGIDGRIARMLKGTSRFGAELDSLADFFNFGVAPALILYFWGLHDIGSLGWIAAMVFAICAALRLARFNVMLDDPQRPVWAGNFFVGVPAPAGAITVLLPIYLTFLTLPRSRALVWFACLYTLAIAFLMVSRLPVFSGKRAGRRVAPDKVVPIFIGAVLLGAALISYPWEVLTIGTIAYLVSLPFGIMSYRRHAEADRLAAPERPDADAAAVPAAAEAGEAPASPADEPPPAAPPGPGGA